MQTYTPNFDDPRTQKRIVKVLQWCNERLHKNEERWIGKSELDKTFGPSGNKLAKYLRSNLLIQGNNYIIGGHPYGYKLKQEGFDKLIKTVSTDGIEQEITKKEIIVKATVPSYKKIAFGLLQQAKSHKFTYITKSDRYFNGLQNIDSYYKPDFWADHGLEYNYDINACAPTILLSLAKRAGLTQEQGKYIEEYLQDKSIIRNLVQNITGLSAKDSKRLVNSLFNGAKLAKNTRCSAFNIVGKNADIMSNLQTNMHIINLRKSISFMWKYIGKTELAKTSKEKWALYFKWERIVLDVIKKELDEKNIIYFTEHDGFRTNKQVDLLSIQNVIRKETGIQIQIQEQKETQKEKRERRKKLKEKREMIGTTTTIPLCGLHLFDTHIEDNYTTPEVIAAQLRTEKREKFHKEITYACNNRFTLENKIFTTDAPSYMHLLRCHSSFIANN